MKQLTEDYIQSEFVLKVNKELPQLRKLLFSVPNGGFRTKREASKLVATGMTAGIPDMILIWNGKAYGLEFKLPNGVTSPVQKDVHRIWKEQGIDVFIVRSADEAFEIVKDIVYLDTHKKNYR